MNPNRLIEAQRSRLRRSLFAAMPSRRLIQAQIYDRWMPLDLALDALEAAGEQPNLEDAHTRTEPERQ